MKKVYTKNISFLAFSAFVIMCPAALAANGNMDLVNERTFALDGITTISISYGSGSVIFLEGEDGALSFKEYLSSDNENYFARTSANGNELSIATGRRLFFPHVHARLEVYLPRSFPGDYHIRLGSGNLDAGTDITAAGSIQIAMSSGTTRLRKVTAPNIRLHSSSGSIHAEGLYGSTNVQISSGSLFLDALRGGEHRVKLSSGSAHISGVSGGGSFSSSSGSIDMEVIEMNRDLAFQLSSGSLDLQLPRGTPFYLDAETSSGRVTVNSPSDTFTVKDRSSVVRPIGENPRFTIRAKLSSGNMAIAR